MQATLGVSTFDTSRRTEPQGYFLIVHNEPQKRGAAAEIGAAFGAALDIARAEGFQEISRFFAPSRNDCSVTLRRGELERVIVYREF